MKITELFQDLISVVLPANCHICGESLPRGRKYLCSGCVAELPRASFHGKLNPIAEALMLIPQGVDGTAFLRYETGNATSTLIHDFKYRGFRGLARFLGETAGEELSRSGFLNGVDMILPVPLHWTKMRRRGYNQAAEIARGIGERAGIPVGNHLKAVRSHSTQTRKTRSQRVDNVEGVFGVKNPEELEGRSLLVVDDVFTTGATLLSAASELARTCRGINIRLFALASAYH